MSTRVSFEMSGHVARLTLDHPERLHAFDVGMAAAVLSRLEAAAADPDVRVLILSGAGATFSAGGDLKAMAGPGMADPRASDGAADSETTGRTLLEIAGLLRFMPAVTIAAIRGVCAGGALGWACACDLRVAATDARFVPAFAAAGQTGDYGISFTLPRIVGEGRARDMLLVGDHIDAAEAERIGLVTRVFEPDQFAAGVSDLALMLSERAPLALRGIKKNLAAAAGSTLGEALDIEAATMAENMRSADAAEAMAAFAEKRPPRFTGH